MEFSKYVIQIMLRKAKYVGSTPYYEGTISIIKMILNYLRNVSYSEKLIVIFKDPHKRLT